MSYPKTSEESESKQKEDLTDGKVGLLSVCVSCLPSVFCFHFNIFFDSELGLIALLGHFS